MREEEGVVFDRGTNDISSDWTELLKALFDMIQILKVPGRKAKCNIFIIIHDIFFLTILLRYNY